MYKNLCICLIICLKGHALKESTVKKVECGYKQCPQTRDGALNVHLIPHSHMDAGWVKTFDEYYYGTRSAISTANVQLIFHSVLSELLHDKRRKFTFSESGYFWRWWKEQRPATRATFRTLVQEGRIEFAGGGWVQNDEATVDYMMILDQYTWGLRKINDTLGLCGKPKAAWQIDTYGHTREHSSLLAQMGYDGLFIGRVDHKDREAMLEEDRMEFMWRGSDVLGKMSDIMTHTLYNLYNAPDGFCFDFLCNEEPIVDDADSRVYNAEKRVNDFISQIERQAKYYEHDNIMVTMGGDFTYQSAANWFVNMDKLINHVNTHPANMSDINIFYSTPSCYLKALYLYGRRDKAIYTERGDHLPYGSDASTYWTGFYSSRPSTKYLARQANAFLQVIKQLTVLTRMGDSYELHLLRHAIGLMVHHDAITGTSQQHVADDFIRILGDAIDSCTKKVSSLLSILTPTWGGSRRSKNNQQFMTCHQMNLSQCRMAETHESILLLVYNPMSVKTYHYVRLPAIALHYTVRDPNDEEVEYQLVPLPTAVINLPGRSSSSIQELVFEAESIPPLGYVAFYIAPVRDQLEENEYAKRQKTVPEMEIIPQISNEYLKVTVDKNTGLLESITHVDGMKVLVTQNFFHYIQGQRTLQSGSYSFRPDKERPTPVVEKVSYNCIRGALVKEIRQRFTDWIYQTVRLYRGEEFVELEWVIGPVPIGNDVGKEVVSIFSTNITNHGEFYTDSNMRQMIKRTCWNETTGQTTKKPVASCYYPVTSRLCIHSTNDTSGICVLPDRCQGGTSYNEGEIELMVHRRLLTDDGFGLDETLNEEDHGQGLIIRGKHRILFGNYRQEVDDLTFSERMSQAAYRWQMEPWHFLTSAEKINRRKWQNVRNKRFSALRVNGLPRHVRVLTLEPWKAGSVLLRLENTLEKTDRVPSTLKSEMVEEFPKPFHITVELRKLFQNFEIKSVRETTLAANQWLEEARQMDWSTRYVYSGADDGILPEDLDYTEEVKSKPEAKDSGYSEEDMDFSRTKPRRHQTDKIKSKVKASNFDKPRSKRSINTTENYMENYVNSSENYVDINRKMYTTEVPKISRKVGHKLGNVSLNVNNVFRKTNLVAMTPKSGFYKRLRQKKHYLEFSSSSSEEDVSLRSRKRNRRRNGRRKRPSGLFAEMNPDETDDGVTKSIYEMYYKTKARVPPFKPLLRAVEEAPEPPPVSRRRSRQFRSKEFEELDQRRKVRSKRRDKHVHADMPFFITRGRKNYKKPSIHYNTEKLKPQTDDEEAEKDMPFFITSGRKLYGTPAVETNTEKVAVERTTVLRVYTEEEETEGSQMPSKLHSDEDYYDDDDADDDEGEEKRKKRATGKDDFHTSPEETDADPDYVITLRPTQIRTFVIKFQNNKKNYVI